MGILTSQDISQGQKMQVQQRKLDEIRPYEKNPRNNDGAVDYVANSIKEFGFKVPIVVDKDGVIVAGHTRWKAAKKLGLETVPCVVADDLTPKQVKAFRLADNKVAEFASWDEGALAEELAALDDAFDMGDFGFEDMGNGVLGDERTPGSLSKSFLIPPFSVLDAKQAHWQSRKKEWMGLLGNLSETRNGEFGKWSDSGLMNSINEGTSNFDPVLAELMLKWFNVDGGKVLDPFGGEQTKGVVAGELGYAYVGCEIRQDQVDLNREKTKAYPNVRYVCGDSSNILELIPERDFDMCFTSPPYYDLEVYSKDDLSALGSYEDFMRMYREIFAHCYEMMKEDSFLVIKIGEIRDKKTGCYRGFVPDNMKLFTELGFKYYNEMVLATMCGTASVRARKSMANRKVCKVHQNVLVFFKGDLKHIGEKFPAIDFKDEGGDDET